MKFVYLLICGLSVVYADFYDCNEPLFDKAVKSATSSLSDRGSTSAKLNGGRWWSPQYNSLNNWISLSFPNENVEIRSVATQGRPSSDHSVIEYYIQYSDDGETWTNYLDLMGELEMFKGNYDGNTVHRNTFKVPIIARWIRINPTRWKNSISMRVEVYGCEYHVDRFYFNGVASIEWHLKDQPIASTTDTFGFRFKTEVANGIIIYSRGTQGDYFCLQLRDNHLVLNIKLGAGLPTSLSVGSLLDDNVWHDVLISRNYREILFSVDRVTIYGSTKGSFSTLNLNNVFYIGGVPNRQVGMLVNQNFTGCIENMYINSTNIVEMIKGYYSSDNWWGMQTYKKHNVSYTCSVQPLTPITFLTENSYATLTGFEGIEFLNVSFSFRTYEPDGLLVYHKFINPGYVKIFLQQGKLLVQFFTETNPLTTLDNFEDSLNDGKWHTVTLTMNTNNLALTLDQRLTVANRKIQFTTGLEYTIAGNVQGNKGFVGCMRLFSVNGNYRSPDDWKEKEGAYCCKNQVVFDACQMIDRCNPNPCKHNGLCSQSSSDFSCECSQTEYGGSMCHTPLHPLSCEAYKLSNTVGQKADIKIDIDGSGPLDPFPVTCQFHSDNRVITEVHHKNEEPTTVNGFQEEGSFKQDIIYDAKLPEMETLINRSNSCWQNIRYDCLNSRLLNSPSSASDFRPFSWWVSRYNQKMDFWGGSIPGSRKCECGILGTCEDPEKWCNCDASYQKWTADGGDIKGKAYLPVKQLRFGDTGTPSDEKEGKFTLGPLMCEGDDLFNNVVTFRKTDATLNIPTYDFGYDCDFYFEFKTTTENAIMVNSKGPDDEILIELREGNTIQFIYKAGNRPVYVSGRSSYNLADNRWHSVFIERNRKGARIVIDGSDKREVREPPGPVLALYLTTPLSIGGSVGPPNPNGFTGCLRAFLVNGRLIDLVSQARKERYGVSIGCVGKCNSNPCLNNGTCIDHYDSYICDCRWTSFKGPICADEIGVTMRDSSMIKYTFDGSWRSTITENIRVGFTTTHAQGFLLGLFSDISKEYMTMTVSNSGHLKIIFDFGFERQELIYPGKHFGLGQFHDVRVRRKNSGSIFVMEVDNYEPLEFTFNIKASADAQFNNIQYLYIGRNETMDKGFIGCISRVEFDDIYPLKLLFQQNGPDNVQTLEGPVVEDFCGVEPVRYPQEIPETRPPLILNEDKVSEAYHKADNALVGGLLFLLFLLTIVIALLISRYVARHKGDYITQEDKGADIALDPDSAVIHSTTGHHVQKKKEWFL